MNVKSISLSMKLLAATTVLLASNYQNYCSAETTSDVTDSKGSSEIPQADSASEKVYVVTGASSGFGKGVALKLGQMKAKVVLAARRAALLDDIAAQITISGGTAIVVPTDVSVAESVEKLAEAAIGRFGRIDVWINNAGVGALGPFENIPLADHSKLIDINLKGTIYGSHVAINQFKKQKFGTLINVGSIDSEVPLAYQASYSASKAAVLSLGRAINEEMRLAGMKKVKVATIMPWAADTPWWDHAANYSGGTARMAMMDDPQIVVDAIVKASSHPAEEIPVGWKAKSSNFFHHVMPDTAESFSASVSHKYQIETAPPAPHTDGTLFQPMPTGTAVEGGVRARMKEEKARSREKKVGLVNR